MKIAVNTRLLLKNKLEGIGWVTYETLRRMVKSHPEVEFYFIFDREPDPMFIFGDNVKPIVLFPQARHPFLFIWFFEFSLVKALKKIKPDLFFSPDGYLSLRSDVPQVTQFHDLNFEHFPKDMPKIHLWHYKTFFPRFASKAKRIVTVSEFSKQDIVECYGIEPEKIDVVYNGVNEAFAPISDEEQAAVRARYTDGNPYFMFVGSLHPRKNLARLFTAFDLFKSQMPSNVKLLIVGEKRWWSEPIEKAYSQMRFKEDVVFAGRLSAEKLHEVTAAALASVYVSYFEGFGIPILEAFKCETPVITSNVTSMPEVADDAALLVDPFSEASIAEGMTEMLDENVRRALIEKGVERAKDFSWDKAAEGIWKCLMKAIDNMEKIVMYPTDIEKEVVDWKAVQGQHITAVKRNILVLGSGGREHALAWKLAKSEGAHVFIAPGNAGTAQVGVNVDVKPSGFEAVKEFCLKQEIGLVVVGPEQPLVDGIVDFFKADAALKSVKIIGPDKRGAQLEGSKAFAKDFMEKYGVPTAKCFKVNKDNLSDGCKFLEGVKAPYVLKADGLAAGKGVLILNDLQEAKVELGKMLDGKFGAASATVVIEEFLKGIEVSVFVLTDGEHYVLLPEAKDYKRIGDGDTGLNTGGMGAVSPVPFCTPEFLNRVEERIVKPTLKGLKAEGIDYKGFIFLGLMNDGGNPYVIEYNVRMGDPETEAVMTRIEGDFADLLDACADGRLDEVHYAKSEMTAVTVMMVSGGYPEAYKKGMKMSGLDKLKEVVAFHAGTAFDAEKNVVTAGGRVIAVTAHGHSIEAARSEAYREVEKIHFEGVNYRHDIGLDLMKMQ